MARKLMMIVAILLAFTAWTPARAANTAKAGFSFTKRMVGVPGRSTGSITFRVNPQSGSFSCSLNGSGKLSGQTSYGDTPVQVNAAINLSSTSCSGTYHPKEGTIDGKISINGAYQSTSSWVSSQGKPRSESDSGSETQSGSIYGNLGPGGRGEVSTGEGTFSWSITSPLSLQDAVEPENPPEPLTAPPTGPQPDAPAEGADGGEEDVVDEFVQDSIDLTNLVMDDYKKYKQTGGKLGFDSYLRKEYPDRKQRDQVETAVRVAAEEKQKRAKVVDTYLDDSRKVSEPAVSGYFQQAVAPAQAAGQEPPSFQEHLAATVPDPAERERIEQAAILANVSAYEQAREGRNEVEESLAKNTDLVDTLWKSLPAVPGDTRESWLQQKIMDQAQGMAIEKARSLLPEAALEKADKFYGQFSGWKSKYDQAKELKETVDGLAARNHEYMEKFKNGDLDVHGVQALRGLNALDATIKTALPDFNGMKKFWTDGLGKALKFSSDFLTYKTNTRRLSPDMSDETAKKFEDSYYALRQYGKAETNQPYQKGNLFTNFLNSINPFAKPKVDPKKARYH